MRTKLLIFAVVIICLAGCTNSKSETQTLICNADNCSNLHHGSYGNYCKDHMCKEEWCGQYKVIDDDYCSFHMKQQITLSESQIEEIRELTNNYCKQIISTHSNILAINIFNDTPKTTTSNIYYNCNVVREDSDTNLATIYIYMTKEGTFKIDKLEYEE